MGVRFLFSLSFFSLRVLNRIVVETRLAASPAACKQDGASPVSTLDLVYFPLNPAARFSRNAAVPSFLSSVAQQTPNKVASRNDPSAKVISIPLLTDSIAYCTASG